ncbi:M4 family metallopeptidase [Paractinoplanes rishiriensis]|uniref:M4 family metallopeptidase n=1 Tax=Paractinoplanes rishiriensis TaxID=1050105 RepID=UPI001941C8B0|nr:M4 family metallopeptidase [Actinoplanes rishiriensis]
MGQKPYPGQGAEAGAGQKPHPGQGAEAGAGQKPRANQEPPPRAGIEPPSRDRAVQDARALVGRHGRAIRAAAGESYQLKGVVVDPDGSRHVRFDRTYRGLPVLGGDYVVHANPDGSFRDTSVAQRQTIAVGTTPVVDAERAKRALPGKDSAARLVVDAAPGTPVLAWQVTGPDGRTVVVDAGSGEVRRRFDSVHRADGTGHSLYSGEVPLSTSRTEDGRFTLTDPDRGGARTLDALDSTYPKPAGSVPLLDDDNVWGDGTRADRATVAADVHYGVAQTFDYFKGNFNRTGVRDDGSAPVAMVHENEANAAFYSDCYCVSFGDGDDTRGPFVSLDIVAHEWAHGVTFGTAGLVYDGESGGLNEATSDIFGTLVEFAANNPNDPPDYLVAEKLGTSPLRYMDEPIRDGQSSSCWNSAIGVKDVHYSSGVANKFFYNLAVGSGESRWGTSTPCAGAPPVTGIGNDKAGQIWYRALTVYMLSNTNYAAARQATLTAAADLYGAGGTEYAAVDAAWKAVNVDGSDPVPQEPAVWRPGNQESVVGDTVRLQIRAEDPQGDDITFAATDLPAGLSMDATGLITGSPTTTGWEYVKISVTDSAGHVGVTYFFWDIFGPPAVTNPGDQTTGVGDWVFLNIEATDDDSDYELTYTFEGMPDGLLGTSTFIYGYPEKAGTWTTRVTVTDSEGRSTTISFGWTVT